MIKEAIDKAVKKIDLAEAEMMAAMEEIMEGKATPAQIAALITALQDERRNSGGSHRRGAHHAPEGDARQCLCYNDSGYLRHRRRFNSILSISPQLRPSSWRRPESSSPSMATAPFPAAAAAPMCWKRSASISAPIRKSWKNAFSKSASAFFSLPNCMAQ